MTRQRLQWRTVLNTAADIVRSFRTDVTLRELFYQLVAREVLPNTRSAYNSLSKQTAEARRQRSFPTLIDRTRQIHRPLSFGDPGHARSWLACWYGHSGFHTLPARGSDSSRGDHP